MRMINAKFYTKQDKTELFLRYPIKVIYANTVPRNTTINNYSFQLLMVTIFLSGGGP